MRSGTGHPILVQGTADATHTHKAPNAQQRCAKPVAGHHGYAERIQKVFKEIGQTDRHCLAEPGRKRRLVAPQDAGLVQRHHQNQRKELYKTHGRLIHKDAAADEHHQNDDDRAEHIAQTDIHRILDYAGRLLHEVTVFKVPN